MSLSDALAALAVVAALVFLVKKLVLAPIARERGPHVPVSRLVRRARAKRAESDHDCCA
jgi:hypothetical protein